MLHRLSDGEEMKHGQLDSNQDERKDEGKRVSGLVVLPHAKTKPRHRFISANV